MITNKWTWDTEIVVFISWLIWSLKNCNNVVSFLSFFFLGFLKTGSKGSPQGNFGLMDLVAGLHWLRENLAAFGGDPDRITLLGHGTGAALANLLAVSPMASGNYQRLIIHYSHHALWVELLYLCYTFFFLLARDIRSKTRGSIEILNPEKRQSKGSVTHLADHYHLYSLDRVIFCRWSRLFTLWEPLFT